MDCRDVDGARPGIVPTEFPGLQADFSITTPNRFPKLAWYVGNLVVNSVLSVFCCEMWYNGRNSRR